MNEMKSATASKVTSASVASIYDAYLMQNYGKPPFALVRGEGSSVWDAEGRRYLDFCSGIAVNSVGHSHPLWVARVQEQVARLVHVSNLYAVPQQAELARRLCAYAGEGRVFFCNSGAEANEALIKLARLWGRKRSGGEEGKCFKVLTAKNAFHGRTFGGMSATPQKKVQDGFAPMLAGFEFAEFNNLESFAAKVDHQTAAIFVETIQGEGGIIPASAEFLQGIRRLCDERGLLLMIDEVQCGIGRTGTFFAFEEAGIRPDAIGMAKGLGGGFPIAAVWVSRGYDELYTPGSHGTTFGGNPLACTAALAVLDIIEQEELLRCVRERSARFVASLEDMVDRHPVVTEVRGRGYHLALGLSEDPVPWVNRLREQGLLTVRGGNNALRLMPPLVVSEADLEHAAEILDFVFAKGGES